jgi:hypothetical protein
VILGRGLSRAALLVAAIALAIIGCQATPPAQPILTDPSEVAMAAIRSTAALQSVHARLDSLFRQGGGFDSGSSVEFDIDLTRRDFAARAVSKGQGGTEQVTEVIFVGGRQFMRDPPNQRWGQQQVVPGQFVFPTNDALVGAISAVIDSGSAHLDLAAAEPCGEATCYHLTAQLDPTSTWQLLAPVLTGAAAAGPPPADVTIPPIAIEFLIDQATRQIVSATTAISLDGSNLAFSLTLSNHDVPVRIVAPPPGLVDQVTDNTGGGGQPAPTPGPVESP